jgi:hypothetical protein
MTAGTPDMTYNVRTPIAVFLGPSLDLATARSILPANYYPPVRMGDIYRLLATGVRLIVIIDGVFHASVPVWQREILAARKAGIPVVGASSMGALRAAELAPYGMIGYGTVFQWYVQGRIAGDDEVALLHAPATQGYRGVSEALVNMRHNLERACQAGILAFDVCTDLLAWLKGLFYGHRTYDALFASPPFTHLPQSTQQALRTFLRDHRRDLKRQDALDTLKLCATHGAQIGALADAHLCPEPGVEWPIEILQRGALTATGQLIPLYDVLRLAAQDRRAIQNIVARASRRFFLLQWMQHCGVRLPAGVREAFYTCWCERYVSGELSAWLAANGLTPQEFACEVADRAAEAWLLAQDPATYGLSWQEHLASPGQRPRGEVPQDVAVWCYVQDWAQRCGIDWPQDLLQRCGPPATPTRGQEDDTGHALPQHHYAQQALVQWLLEQSPAGFGYMQWSADMAFARALQITGKIAALARAWGDATHDHSRNVSLGHPSVGVA